ncbi:MAG TPA: phosphate uptake regulator PhoU [Solirubrobacteraceae bacterium]|nr:phosphate uptake regulator PhoU [Solirubrobacteraceae bacterium]
MRPAFAQQLVDLERRIVGHLAAAANTLATIAAAVRAPSAHRIGAIADDGRALRSGANAIHTDLVVVAARQTPVAGDLRLVVAMIDLAHHTGLIANQFGLIAGQLAEIDPDTHDPSDAAEQLAEMAAVASAQLRKATTAFSTRDLRTARELDADDDRLDQLNRRIFELAAHAEGSSERLELGMHCVLIARCLERIGDNAVDIAEQAAFLLTAELREFSDASHPDRA